jgi:dTDP-4-dehydrorhamnose 3,5-epimerase-like enzyme
VQQGRYDELLEDEEGAFAELARRQNVDTSSRKSAVVQAQVSRVPSAHMSAHDRENSFCFKYSLY